MNEFEFPAPSKELPVFTKSQNKPKPDHDPRRYGEIPGALVGSTFPSRHACWKAGVHGHTQAGIHGSESAPAYSIVMSGRYADDCDQGDTFIYSGEGGRSKEVAGKSKFFGERCANQVWNRGNKSLQLSHATGRPVRVIRGHMLHSRYAPAEGFRYDGLYRVTQVVYGDGKTGDGKNGFKTCKFTFDRLPDQPPLPNEVLKPTKSRSRKATSMPRTSKPAVGLLRPARPGPSASSSSSEDEVDELESPTTVPVSLKRKRGEDGDNGDDHRRVLNYYGFTRPPFVSTASSSAAPPRPTLHGFVSAPIPPIVPGWVAPLDKYGSTRTPVVTTASSSPAPSKPTQPGFGASPIPPFMCTPSIPTGSSSAPSFVSAPCPPSVSVSAPGVCLALKPTEPPPRLSDAAQALRDEYKHANFDMMCKRGAISGWEWGVLCLEYHCPGRLYTPCEGETMEKFRVHLLNYHVANYPSTPTAESAPPVVPAAPPPTAFSPAASSLVSYPTFSPSTVPARAPGLSSPMGVLSDPASHLEETVVNWIRNTPNATTTAFTRYFALYMTDVGNRNKLFDVVRKVAQARKVADTAEGIQGILWLKEAYQGPQVM